MFNYVQICLNILNYGILSLKKLGLCCASIEFAGSKTYESNGTAWIQDWWKLAKIVDHFSHSKTVAVCIASYFLPPDSSEASVVGGISHRGMTVAELFQCTMISKLKATLRVLSSMRIFWGVT